MYINGKTWRASLAALCASLVLVTGFGSSSPAAADHITVSADNRVVDANKCLRTDKYDRRVWLYGTFDTVRGLEKSRKRTFYGDCFRIAPNGEVQTSLGALWIYDGSAHFLNGYAHGEDIAYDGVGSHRLSLYGSYEVDGVPTWLDGEYYITSSGEIHYKGGFRRLGEWSDWYEAGGRNGYAAAQRRLDACFNRISLVNVKPRTYGPELTFQVEWNYADEIPPTVWQVTVGFREISEGNRQPQITSGTFPWCVKSWFYYSNEGPRQTINFGDHSYVLSYDAKGPYYQRNSFAIPGWEPKKYHNEDLWKVRRLPVTG